MDMPHRHSTRSRADVQIGVHIRHNDEALFRKDLGRADGLLIVRQQVLAVAHNFDLDEIAAAARTRQTRNTNRLVGIAGTRGVRQQRHALRNIVEDVSRAALICAAQRQRDDLRAVRSARQR